MSLYKSSGLMKTDANFQLFLVLFLHFILFLVIVYIMYIRSKKRKFRNTWTLAYFHLILLASVIILVFALQKGIYNKKNDGMKLSINYKKKLMDSDLDKFLDKFESEHNLQEFSSAQENIYQFLINFTDYKAVFNLDEGSEEEFKKRTTVRELIDIIRRKELNRLITYLVFAFIIMLIYILYKIFFVILPDFELRELEKNKEMAEFKRKAQENNNHASEVISETIQNILNKILSIEEEIRKKTEINKQTFLDLLELIKKSYVDIDQILL